ncbi:TetR/AcrR family transcriptional regulator [Pseudonocardiaceae bacterium YIM PH 21723]|nr:TetR/AcrR family transcriptional regulator [Pseudonocardiaceae bacterium YIM PH 21723]
MSESVQLPVEPGSDGRARRWAGQRDSRRAQVVDAAIDAIQQYGPDVSTEQIAQVAGMPRPRLYRYFDGKEDLRTAVVTRAVELLGVEAIGLLKPRGSVMDYIDGSVRSLVSWIDRHANLYWYIQSDATSESAAYQNYRAALALHLTTLTELVADELGLERKVTPTLIYGLIGMVESSIGHWVDNRDELTRDELTENLVRWIWSIVAGIATHAGNTLDPDSTLGRSR